MRQLAIVFGRCLGGVCAICVEVSGAFNKALMFLITVLSSSSPSRGVSD